jgi:uncharacterized membrane protein YbhN (UPF0104 family)
MEAAWAWLPLRVADLIVGSFRLWLCFRIAGHPLAFDQVVVAAAAGILVSLLGVTPNGLGLREWVVAALAAVLAPVSSAAGLLAALLDRAAEILVILPTGLVSSIRLIRHP